jgi:hypothetical protein
MHAARHRLAAFLGNNTLRTAADRSQPIAKSPVNDAPMDMIIHSLSFQPHT